MLDGFPKSPEVPEAMWLMAQSFVDLKFCTDARAFLQDLLRRYPALAAGQRGEGPPARSAEAGERQARLRELSEAGPRPV